MKTLKSLETKFSLLKYKLIETEIYDKRQYVKNIKIEDIEYRLKKILYIIYKYHILNRKILFIGAPLNISYKLKKFVQNNHVIVPNKIWERGALGNKTTCFKHLAKNSRIVKNKTLSNFLFELKKNVHLIVLFEDSKNYLEILSEAHKLQKTPIISISSDIRNLYKNDYQQRKPTYKTFGNFKFNSKSSKNSLIYETLLSILKKGNKDKKKLQFLQIQKKQRITNQNLKLVRKHRQGN